MRNLREDLGRRTHPEDGEVVARKREAAPTVGRLSEADATAYEGQRLANLDDRQRETVADQALMGPERALPHRGEMEARFGRSFSDVKVAGSAGSSDVLQGVGASGVSRDGMIAFRDKDPSREVVAHELAHIVQGERNTGDAREAEAGAHGVEASLEQGGPIHVAGGLGGAAAVAHFRDDNDHSQYEHKSPYEDRHRKPDDETPVDWNQYVKLSQPPDPYIVRKVAPGPASPFPPNAVMEKPPSHHQQDDEYPNPFKDEDHRIIVDHFHLVRRQQAWEAYGEMAYGVEQMETNIQPDIDLFRHAEKNEELKALGFIMNKGFTGDLVSLTGQQEVPKQGGPTVDSLFNKGEGTLNMTKADEKSVEGAALAREKGKGGVEDTFLGTQKADTDLQASLHDFKGAADDVTASKAAVEAAVQAIEFVNAEKEAGEAQEEIEQLKKTAEFAKSFIEFAVSGPAKLATLAEEGIDKLEAVGTIATLILDTFPIAGMKAAEDKLAAAKEHMATAKAKQLSANLESAKATALGAVEKLEAKKKLVQSAMTSRRQAYNKAGAAASESATGSKASKGKVGGFISAIPIVENAVAALRNIVDKTHNCVPKYDPEAGLGYGMALYDKEWEAYDLPVAMSELLWMNTWFGFMLDEWQSRLKSLQAQKEVIGGTRPGE